MKNDPNDDDDLIWEIGSGETSNRRAPSVGTVQHVHGRSSLNARLLLITVGIVLVGLLIYWAVSQWQIYNAQESIRALIRREDAAAYARDVDGVRASLASGDPAWEEWILQQVMAGQASPLPDPDLSAEPGEPETVFIFFNLEEAHVQVYRTFKDISGAPFRYRFDQRYQQVDGEWKRVPIPDSYWGDRLSFFGSRLALRFSAADESLLTKDIGPEIERLLVRWCSSQPCADETLPVRIGFVSDLAPVGLTEATPGDGQFLTPRLAGHPIGQVAVDRFLRKLQVWSYRGVAERTYLTDTGEPDTARIDLVGVCLGILPGSRDPQTCTAIGVR